MSRQHLGIAEDLLAGLDRRHAIAMDAYRDMEHAGSDALPGLWRRFLECHDDYLEAMRNARCALAEEEYIDNIAATAFSGRANADVGVGFAAHAAGGEPINR